MNNLIESLLKLFTAFTTFMSGLLKEPESLAKIKVATAITIVFVCLCILTFFAYVQDADAQDWYVDLGAGYRIDSTELYGPDYETWRNSRFPTAYFAIGFDAGDWRVELGHYSNWFIGPPLNAEPELHLTEIRFIKRFSLFRR